MRVLLATPDLTIAHDAANRLLIATWHGTHTSGEKKARCEQILQQARQTDCTTLLNDGSQDLDGWSDALYWLSHDYQQGLRAAGIVAAALVVPRSLNARADVHRALTIISRLPQTPANSLVFDTFMDIEAAASWLKSTALSVP